MPFGKLTQVTTADPRMVAIECHVAGVLVAKAVQNQRGWWVDDIDIAETPVQRFNTRAEAEDALERLAAAWAALP